MNFALYIVKVEKKNSSENKMPLVKVVPNDPSYCSKFSSHGRNLKNVRARAQKPSFLPFLQKVQFQQDI